MKKIIIVVGVCFVLLVPSVILASEGAQTTTKTTASALTSPPGTPEKDAGAARKERLAKLAAMNSQVASPSTASVSSLATASSPKPVAVTNLDAARKARIAELAKKNSSDSAEDPAVAKAPEQETEKIARNTVEREREAKAADLRRKVNEQASILMKKLYEEGAATLELAVEKAFGKNVAVYTGEQKAAIELVRQELEASVTLFALLGTGVSAGIIPVDGAKYLFNLAREQFARGAPIFGYGTVVGAGAVTQLLLTYLVWKVNQLVLSYPTLAPIIYTAFILVLVRHFALEKGAMPGPRPAAANTNSGADKTGKEEKGVQDKDKKDK